MPVPGGAIDYAEAEDSLQRFTASTEDLVETVNAVLDENWERVEQVVHALLSNGTLNGAELLR